jgi:hypothetical protein
LRKEGLRWQIERDVGGKTLRRDANAQILHLAVFLAYLAHYPDIADSLA